MTRSRLLTFAALLSFALTASVLGAAQNKNKAEDLTTQRGPRPPAVHVAANPNIYKPEGRIITPASNTAAPGHFHTNYHIFAPNGYPVASPQLLTNCHHFADNLASLGCVYNVGPIYPGCNPATGRTNHPTGGWGAIVLVDAYDNPNAAADLAFFCAPFGLPVANFRKVYANQAYGIFSYFGAGSLSASCLHAPPVDANWGLEEDLDIEWAHVMAPSAQIVLVEACSNSYEDLFFTLKLWPTLLRNNTAVATSPIVGAEGRIQVSLETRPCFQPLDGTPLSTMPIYAMLRVSVLFRLALPSLRRLATVDGERVPE